MERAFLNMLLERKSIMMKSIYEIRNAVLTEPLPKFPPQRNRPFEPFPVPPWGPTLHRVCPNSGILAALQPRQTDSKSSIFLGQDILASGSCRTQDGFSRIPRLRPGLCYCSPSGLYKSSLERFQWNRMKLARHKTSKMATMFFLVKVVELVDRGRKSGIASGIGGEFSGKTCITLLARPISWFVSDKEEQWHEEELPYHFK